MSGALSKISKKYNKKEIFALKAVFDEADADGSGEIDSSELRRALSKSSLSAAAVDMFKALDKDGSKRIGFDEYLKAYYKFASPAEIKELMLWVYPPKEEEVVEQRKLSDAQKAEIKSIFVLYDANNNGLLEKKELFEALTASGYDDDEIEEMFEEYDQDGSHAIDFDEFCAMLESSYLDS